MCKENLLNESTTQALMNHSYRLSNIKQAFDLLRWCYENNFYFNTKAELSSLGYVLSDYIKNTKEKFSNIEESLGIEL